MAQDMNLGPGQINPAAKPVDAFVAPAQYSVAQPGSVIQLPQVKGVDTVNTGGTTYVQGSNSFAELANALKPFSKAVMETSEQAGLQYAGWQIQKGEAAFMEAYRKAQLNVDQSTEVGEAERAKANREVAIKDPAAGSMMWMLNPYFQIGAERARSKLAGNEIAMGMGGYVASRAGEIDYESPDQGFAALQAIRSDYISQVTKKYGVNDNSAGFQKYTATEIEKASEKAATKLQEDRVKYFEEMKPKQLAQLLLAEYNRYQRTKPNIELDGSTYVYREGGDNSLYWGAFGRKLNNTALQFTQTAGLPGQASEWQREAYEILSADADFTGDNSVKWLLGSLTTSTPLKGSNGKPITNANGDPIYLSWDQLYGKERIDSQLKYEQAGFSMRASRARDLGARGAGVASDATQGMTPGPERYQAGLMALDQYIQEEERKLGRSLTPQERFEIRKGWKESNDLTDDLVFEQDDPGQQTRFFARLSQDFGSNFNAANARAEAEAIAAGMRDQKAGQQFLSRALTEISKKEKEQQDFSGYTTARNKVIEDNIKARIQRNYRIVDPNFGKPDRVESERRQRQAYVARVNDAIRKEEGRLGRKLTESEVRSTTQAAIDAYGKDNIDELSYLFPGSLAYPKSPSVDPRYTIKPVEMDANGKPIDPNAYKGKVYDINQLDSIPNRSVELRLYQSKPVMSLPALLTVLEAALDGQQRPMKFERAWRDAGAPSAKAFVEAQLKFYPRYELKVTEQEKGQIWKNLQSSSAQVLNSATIATLQQSMPMMAGIAGWSDLIG